MVQNRRKQKKGKNTFPNSREGREALLQKELSKYVGTTFFCPALNADVHIVQEGIDETVWNARFSQTSTKLALKMPLLFRKASVVDTITVTPEIKKCLSNTLKKFDFETLFILRSELKRVGIAKILVGSKKVTKHIVEYSVTDMDFKKTEKKGRKKG